MTDGATVPANLTRPSFAVLHLLVFALIFAVQMRETQTTQLSVWHKSFSFSGESLLADVGGKVLS
jgi:hypothetical protein